MATKSKPSKKVSAKKKPSTPAKKHKAKVTVKKNPAKYAGKYPDRIKSVSVKDGMSIVTLNNGHTTALVPSETGGFLPRVGQTIDESRAMKTTDRYRTIASDSELKSKNISTHTQKKNPDVKYRDIEKGKEDNAHSRIMFSIHKPSMPAYLSIAMFSNKKDAIETAQEVSNRTNTQYAVTRMRVWNSTGA